MRKIVFFSIIIISLFIINNLLHSIFSLSQKQDLLVSAQKQLEQEKKENQQLKQQLQQVNNQQFVEEQARDKLLMVKPGEHLVVLPQVTQEASSGATVTAKPVKKLENWQQWIALFWKPGS